MILETTEIGDILSTRLQMDPGYMAVILNIIWEQLLPEDPDTINIAVTHGDDAFLMIAGFYGKEYADKLRIGKIDPIIYFFHKILF